MKLLLKLTSFVLLQSLGTVFAYNARTENNNGITRRIQYGCKCPAKAVPGALDCKERRGQYNHARAAGRVGS